MARGVAAGFVQHVRNGDFGSRLDHQPSGLSADPTRSSGGVGLAALAMLPRDANVMRRSSSLPRLYRSGLAVTVTRTAFVYDMLRFGKLTLKFG
jgi:hypothetical protein